MNTEPTALVPNKLKLSSNDTVLMGVEYRTIQRIIPSQGANGYSPEGTNVIQFQWTHSEADAYENAVLLFEFTGLQTPGGAVDSNAAPASMSDLIDRVEFYHDSAELLNSANREVSVAQNAVMMNELSPHWFEHEAKTLMGWSSQTINDHDDGSVPAQSGKRVYAIPLWAIHAGFIGSKLHPVLGSQMRMNFHLNEPRRCLSLRSASTTTYKLDKVELQVEKTVLSPDYKEALMTAIKSDQGFRINYFDYDIQALPAQGSSTETHIVRNDHSNALSLYLFNVDRRRPDTSANAVFNAKSASYPSMAVALGNRVEKMRVESGERSFTGIKGSNSLVEHYAHLERCAGSFARADGTGAIEFDLYNGNGVPVPMSPLAVSLERTTLEDTNQNVLDRGLSGLDVGATRDIDVNLTFASTEEINTQYERLFSCLVYQKTLVLQNGEASVEH